MVRPVLSKETTRASTNEEDLTHDRLEHHHHPGQVCDRCDVAISESGTGCTHFRYQLLPPGPTKCRYRPKWEEQPFSPKMTLVSTVAPLAGYAIVFQTLVYLLIPARRRTLMAPVLTGVVGAVLTLGAGWIFGFETIGLATPDMAVVAAWAVATVLVVSAIGGYMLRKVELRPLLADPRFTALNPRQAFMQIAIRIPVMTALIEEAFFRGVLHAALIALYPPSVALFGGAFLFGLWHVGPGFDQARATSKDWRRKARHVGITVLATSVAGVALVWLRMETGSIWAPVAVHAGVNMTMAVYARLGARRRKAGVFAH